VRQPLPYFYIKNNKLSHLYLPKRINNKEKQDKSSLYSYDEKIEKFTFNDVK